MINNGAKQKRIAIFDLDGTLVDSDKWMAKELTGSFGGLGIFPSEEEINTEGKRDKYALAGKYGFSKEELDRSYRENVKHIHTLDNALRSGDVTLYPDALSVLEELKENGVVLGLLPRASRESNVFGKLRHFGLEKYFGDRINIVSNGQTKYQGALSLLERTQGQDGKVYCIGDRAEDVVIAGRLKRDKQIDASGVYVHRLNSPDSNLAGYKNVKTLDEIPELILK